MPKLIRNAFKCKRCKQIVESKHRHDFQSCKCGNFTDGGLSYIRRGGKAADMIELSQFEPDYDEYNDEASNHS